MVLNTYIIYNKANKSYPWWNNYEWNTHTHTPQLYETIENWHSNVTTQNEFITLIGLSFTQICSVFATFPFILPAFESVAHRLLSLWIAICKWCLVTINSHSTNSEVSVNCQCWPQYVFKWIKLIFFFFFRFNGICLWNCRWRTIQFSGPRIRQMTRKQKETKKT